MQRTCNRCGGLLAPGATACSYCGQPVADAYPQQNYPPPTQYGTYSPTAGSTDPYAAQYGTQAAPPPPPATAVSGPPYGGQPTYGAPPATAFGAPVQQPPFGTGSQPSPFQTPPPQPPQKKSSAPLIGVILAIIVVLAGLGVGGYFIFAKGGNGPTPTVTSTPNLTLYQASLNKDPGGWDCQADSCSFRADGYHLRVSDDSVYNSFLTQTFGNMQIEVQGIISSGQTSGKDTAALGIAFRAPQSNKLEGYNLLVYADGSYQMVKWNSDKTGTNLIDVTNSAAIHPGLNQANDLKLVINGNQFTIYINGTKVNTTSDSTYPNGGYIGLSDTGKGAEAIYSNLVITKLQS